MGVITYPGMQASWRIAIPKKKATLIVTDEYVTMFHLEYEVVLATKGNAIPLVTSLVKLAVNDEELNMTLAILDIDTKITITDRGIEFMN